MAQAVREAVGVFHDERSLQSAVDDLLLAGFDRSCISLLGDRREVERTFGERLQRVTELEDDPQAPRRHFAGIDSRTEAKGALVGGLGYVGAVAGAGVMIASGGAIPAILLGAAVAGGAGGAIGAAVSRLLERHHSSYLREQLDRGGLLLWVRTAGDEQEKLACTVLARHSADDVHCHDCPDCPDPLEGGVSHEFSFMKRLGL